MSLPNPDTIVAGIQKDGYFIAEGIFGQEIIDDLLDDLSTRSAFVYTEDHAPDHNLLKISNAVREVANAEIITDVVKELTGTSFIALKAIILDKSASYNWGLDWHQDLKIQVKEEIQADGYDNWSIESGILNVVPPTQVLQTMLTVRVHLDDCNEYNGAILVIAGSHREQMISPEAIEAIKNTASPNLCTCGVGAVMFMSPLLLHKSPYAIADMPRRILQIEYGPAQLPGGLNWHQ